MNQVTMNESPTSTEAESGMKKTGKLICGYCIMLALGIPLAVIVLVLAAKFLG